METILDHQLEEISTEHKKVVYGSFWLRFLASFLDGLVITPFTLILMFSKLTGVPALLLSLFINTLGLCYKPCMKTFYGATLGKMALRLRVVNANFGKANFKEILLRNSLSLVPHVILSFVYIFNEFDYGRFKIEDYRYSSEYGSSQWLVYCMYAITVVDGIYLISDNKYFRALHDRIAKTYVIKE